MQTFLPCATFVESAQALDRQRLGKQRVEAKQILQALGKTSGGWVNHPAVKMWRGYETALAYYGFIVCEEWVRRGYRDTLMPWFYDIVNTDRLTWEFPWWWKDSIDLRLSHQSNLIRKMPEHYGPLFPGVPDDLPYIWPVN
jgi:hypothetical protein